ncbi:MAG: S41 family peptidase [Candidatus Cloacimonadia bacterium]
MKRKSLVIIIACLLVVGFFTGRFSSVKAENSSKDLYSYMRLFTEVLTKINQYYVEEIDPEETIFGAIDGMMDTMDPYTTFLTAEEFAELRTSTQGEFGGLGIHISTALGDYITVMSVIESGPAYYAGLLAGDEIISVDGTSTKGWDSDLAVQRLRGPKNSSVTIKVQREGIEEPLEFEIERDIVKIEGVPYVYEIKDGIGYIKITNFNASVGDDLHAALSELDAEGLDGVLIDLRFNPGGLLSQAIATVDEFLPENKLVVYTKGRQEGVEQEFYTRTPYAFNEDIPIIVLINQASASASEIFAGSLQDWDRALIVGENSFGKGSVQQLFPLSMGHGLKITTSKYYIKSGRCIDKGRTRSEQAQKETDNENDNEKKEVFYTVGGREVYGGGGITPDVIIKQDTLNSFEVAVRSKNLFFSFAVNFLANNEINKDFTLTDKVFHEFLDYIKEHDIEYTEKELAESEKWLRNSLGAQIVSNKFGLEEGNKIAVKQDQQLQKALALFDQFDTLEDMFAYSEGLKAEKQ